jgi:CBS domain-containing protein
MRTVADVMTRDPVGVVTSAPLETAAALMIRHHFRHLPVLDDAEGRLVGLVDDSAVFSRGEWVDRAFQHHDPRDAGTRVSDAQSEALTAEPGSALSAALTRMVAEGRDALVVIENHRRPVGILTAHDAVRTATWFLPDTLTTDQLAAREVLSIARGGTVGAALDTMRAHRRRHLVVVDGDRPVGVLSWRDLVIVDASWRRSRRVEELDLGPVETVPQGTALVEVADRMVAQKIGALPVVDRAGALVGVVSRADLMGQIAARLG